MPLSFVSERPSVAFVLSLIAGICYLVVGILFALAGAVVGGLTRRLHLRFLHLRFLHLRFLHLRFLHLRFLHLPRFPNPPRDSGERRRRAESEAPLNLGAAVATVRGKSFGLFRHGIPKRFYRVEQESGECDPCWKPNVD